MRCINCQTDNNFKERTANKGKCKNCGHRFVFDPKSGSKFSDPSFQKSLDIISNQNTCFFTKKQFAYLWGRRLAKKDHGSRVLEFLLLLIWHILSFTGQAIFLGVKGLVLPKKSNLSKNDGFFELIIRYIRLQHIPDSHHANLMKPIADNQLENWINRWSRVNEKPEKLLPPPKIENTHRLVDFDIEMYSFDRAIVCDTATIAQLLIANNIHFDYQCAILGVTAYPQNIFSTVLEMLKRNPNLIVYALHDASPRGVGLVYRLRNSRYWFKNREITIYEIGLRPKQILSKKGFFVVNSSDFQKRAKQLPAEIKQTLAEEELEWLESGNFVELESLTSRKILQVVRKALSFNVVEWKNVDESISDLDLELAISSSVDFG